MKWNSLSLVTFCFHCLTKWRSWMLVPKGPKTMLPVIVISKLFSPNFIFFNIPLQLRSHVQKNITENCVLKHMILTCAGCYFSIIQTMHTNKKMILRHGAKRVKMSWWKSKQLLWREGYKDLFLILLKSVVKFLLSSNIPTSPCMKHKDQGSLATRRLHSSSARLLFAELLQISSSFPTVISYPLVAFGEGSALFLPFNDEERSVPGLLLWPPL